MSSFAVGAIAIIFTLKALGGSFHRVFDWLATPQYSMPAIGGTISVLMLWFFIKVLSSHSLKPARPTSYYPSKIFLAAVFIIIATASAIRIHHIHTTPLDIGRADNIPTLLSGLSDVRHGKSPYHAHTLTDGRTIPHYFLPVLWMSYLPFYLAGLDVRYLNVLAHVIFYVLLTDIFLRFALQVRQDHRIWLSHTLFLGLIGLHAFSKQMITHVVDVQHAPFWLSYTLFVWSLLRGFYYVPLVLIPIVSLTRESAFLLIVPTVIYFFRYQRKRFYHALFFSLGIGLALTLPFIIESGDGLLLAAKHYQQTMQVIPWQEMLRYYGLSGIVKGLGLLALAPVFQWSGLAAAVWLCVTMRELNSAKALALGAIAYLPFILFVSITFSYLFVEPLILTYMLLYVTKARHSYSQYE